MSETSQHQHHYEYHLGTGWSSRISWGSVLAGAFIALASQLLLSSLGMVIVFAIASATSAADLRVVLSVLAFWIGISALITSFYGAFSTSRLADAHYSSDGIWHGATVWAFSLFLGVFFFFLLLTGLLGFGGGLVAAFRDALPPLAPPTDIRSFAGFMANYALLFLLGSVLTLLAALLGGWSGSRKVSRYQSMQTPSGRGGRMAA